MKTLLLIIKTFGRNLELFFQTRLSKIKKLHQQKIAKSLPKTSNILKNLKIPECSETNRLAEEIANPILKSVLKYEKHSSVTAIRNLKSSSLALIFFVRVAEFLKLNPRKAAQSTDVLVNFLRIMLIYLQTIFEDFLMNL